MACPNISEPGGCWNVRCQLGKSCIDPNRATPNSACQCVAGPDMRYAPLVKAAINLIAECRERHDTLPSPQKYSVPYGAVVALQAALTNKASNLVAASASVAWMPFALTLNSALERGDDPAMLMDENSPLRDELRRLISAERAAMKGDAP